MKTIQIFFALFFSLGLAPAQTWLLEVKQSQVDWTGKAAFSAYSLSGTLSPAWANFTLADGTMTSAQLTINMKSLAASDKDLQKHLRSKDFFEVKKYPKASFTLTEPVKLAPGEAKLSGRLTIKGETHPIQFTALMAKEQGQWSLKGKMVIDRTKYGIYYNSPNFFDNLKGQAIADEFELAFDLRFSPSPQP
ncbi:MAG: YceI family protein [Bacteroidota bacterium]